MTDHESGWRRPTKRMDGVRACVSKGRGAPCAWMDAGLVQRWMRGSAFLALDCGILVVIGGASAVRCEREPWGGQRSMALVAFSFQRYAKRNLIKSLAARAGRGCAGSFLDGVPSLLAFKLVCLSLFRNDSQFKILFCFLPFHSLPSLGLLIRSYISYQSILVIVDAKRTEKTAVLRAIYRVCARKSEDIALRGIPSKSAKKGYPSQRIDIGPDQHPSHPIPSIIVTHRTNQSINQINPPTKHSNQNPKSKSFIPKPTYSTHGRSDPFPLPPTTPCAKYTTPSTHAAAGNRCPSPAQRSCCGCAKYPRATGWICRARRKMGWSTR